MIKLIIDEKEVEVAEGTTIMQAADQSGIEIPRLCYDPELAPLGACRLCIVQVEGNRLFPASCVTPVSPGMVVHTESPDIVEARRTVLELLVGDHDFDCVNCGKMGDCKLSQYCFKYGIEETPFQGEKHSYAIDDTNPFIIRNLNKCILCGACVRACEELTGADNLSYIKRGFHRKAATAGDVDYIDSDRCVFCGQCVAVCPTGALQEKSIATKARRWEIERVRTTCPFCGTGCNFDLAVKDNEVIGVLSNPDSTVNQRRLCVKGRFGWDFIYDEKRLKTPLIKKNGEFVEASWDEAFALIAQRLGEIKEQYGTSSFAALSSASCTNEENYLVQKFTRAVMGNNNVDHCARTGHASTVAGLVTTFGSDAMTNSINEISTEAELLFLIGTNATEAHPVIGYKMRQAARKGCKLVVCDPRHIDLVDEADYWLCQKPDTDIPLLNGLMHIIIQEGLEDKKFIAERTENYEELKAMVENYPPAKVSELTGISVEDLYAVARLYATTDKAMIFYTLGINEHICGTRNVMSCANLAMLTGHLGRPGVGVCPIRGQNNVQGACDQGALPNVYSGYQNVAVPEVKEKFEKAWGKPMLDKVGLKISEMFVAAHEGTVKSMYILGENPVLTDPDSNHIKGALEKLDFLVVQELFLTETAEYADVILPAVSFAECDGTFTNTERRVQRVRKAIDPLPGKANWETICALFNVMGYPVNYGSPKDIWDEMASLTPAMAGINYERIEQDGIQWPCPNPDHPGTQFLYAGKFTCGPGSFHI